MQGLELPRKPLHVVGVCGGAVAGSEAAARVAARGAVAIVFEQNPRPYGKVEDGLPRWHIKLRQKEYARIDANLDRPGVLYVPNTRLGRDISFAELTGELGLSALVLATGAWRDRPLTVPGIDAYLGRGLVYQNPLVYWFNHHVEKAYAGPRFEVPDGAIVIGGGLASIDVAKILNFELYEAALHARGIDVDVETFETKGIPRILEEHGLEPASLGVRGCTLYYRRRKRDMPLATADDPTPAQLAKLEIARAKIMDKVMRKYLVRFEERCVPVAPIVQSERLVGLAFRRTEVRERRVMPVDGSDFEVRTQMVVSSIGSVPEALQGVPMKGELYDYASWETGQLAGHEGVYGLGNVLTGRGNIKESRKSAGDVAQRLLETYLGLGGGTPEIAAMVEGAHAEAAERVQPIIRHALERGPALAPQKVGRIYDLVRRRWREVGYDGSYRRWIERVTPTDMV